MSELQIKYAGSQGLTMEYGKLMEATDGFLALVPESMHGGSAPIALALVCNDPALTSAAHVHVETAVLLQSGEYRVTGTRTRLNKARRQDNFRLSGGSSLTSRDTAVDASGYPLIVTYNGVTQQKVAQVEVPLYDITCVGIRDITPIGSVTRLQSLWTGGVNSGIFDAFENANIGAGGLICAGVHYEPHHDDGNENMYRLKFHFIGSPDGWQKYVYWIDPDTGNPPNDGIPANWSQLYKLQHEFDYQTAWPFGDDTGD